MDLTDIIALAKNGYKPADIKELIELSQTSSQGQTGTEGKESESQGQTGTEGKEPENQGQTGTDGTDDKTAELQKQIEELNKKLADQNETLKKAQEANRQQNLGKTKEDQKITDSDRIADWAASFM